MSRHKAHRASRIACSNAASTAAAFLQAAVRRRLVVRGDAGASPGRHARQPKPPISPGAATTSPTCRPTTRQRTAPTRCSPPSPTPRRPSRKCRAASSSTSFIPARTMSRGSAMPACCSRSIPRASRTTAICWSRCATFRPSQHEGKTWFVPWEWGFTSFTYRTDLVKVPEGGESWSDAVGRGQQGQAQHDFRRRRCLLGRRDLCRSRRQRQGRRRLHRQGGGAAQQAAAADPRLYHLQHRDRAVGFLRRGGRGDELGGRRHQSHQGRRAGEVRAAEGGDADLGLRPRVCTPRRRRSTRPTTSSTA